MATRERPAELIQCAEPGMIVTHVAADAWGLLIGEHEPIAEFGFKSDAWAGGSGARLEDLLDDIDRVLAE